MTRKYDTEDLFEHRHLEHVRNTAPLAEHIKPASFDEFLRQEHTLVEDKVLHPAPSILFWRPPVPGKTMLGRLITKVTQAHFEPVSAGMADPHKAVAVAQEHRPCYQEPNILFVDEIHQFNKAKQDVILPHVEGDTVIHQGNDGKSVLQGNRAALVALPGIHLASPGPAGHGEGGSTPPEADESSHLACHANIRCSWHSKACSS